MEDRVTSTTKLDHFGAQVFRDNVLSFTFAFSFLLLLPAAVILGIWSDTVLYVGVVLNLLWVIGALLVYKLSNNLFCLNKRIAPFINLRVHIQDRVIWKEISVTFSALNLFILILGGIILIPLYVIWCNNWKYEHMGDDPRFYRNEKEEK